MVGENSVDGELEVGWDGPVLANGNGRPKLVFELTDGELVTCRGVETIGQ